MAGDSGSSLERELNYYRRECNDLGARLLRLQEEQSQAFREARRSRTLVKLLREAYRLGDVGTSAADVGGPMLELVVDNALCDRAAFLREEPNGSPVAGSPTASRYSRCPCAWPVSPSAVERNNAATSFCPSTSALAAKYR